MNRSAALNAAIAAVADRPNQYGKPEQNFERIAALWNAHIYNACGFGAVVHVKPHDVAIMLALVKIARLEADPTHADSWIDLAGYAGCGAEVSGAHLKDIYQSAAGEARMSTAKPAQNSDLVDDVLLRMHPVCGRPLCPICWPKPETKFGFTVGETVNLKKCGVGSQPGTIIGFPDDLVEIQWDHNKQVRAFSPSDVRHGI